MGSSVDPAPLPGMQYVRFQNATVEIDNIDRVIDNRLTENAPRSISSSHSSAFVHTRAATTLNNLRLNLERNDRLR